MKYLNIFIKSKYLLYKKMKTILINNEFFNFIK